MDLKVIRAKSLKLTAKFDLPINNSLPLLDTPTHIRFAGDVFIRLMCLHVVAACAYGLDRAKAKEWIAQEAIANCLTNSELNFISHGDGDPEKFKLQIEGMWALAWSLGLVSLLDFSKECEPRFAALLPNLKILQPTALLKSKVSVRPLHEIVEACDLAYCLHWGIRQQQLLSKQIPVKIVPFIVIERRRALDWLIEANDWDDVSLDT